MEDTFFLVTPGIFQRYAAEHPGLAAADSKSDAWRRIQRQFEKMHVHLKTPNGLNIWTCTVRGPRSASSLNGYLLRDARSISGELPTNNPFLTLMP